MTKVQITWPTVAIVAVVLGSIVAMVALKAPSEMLGAGGAFGAIVLALAKQLFIAPSKGESLPPPPPGAP